MGQAYFDYYQTQNPNIARRSIHSAYTADHKKPYHLAFESRFDPTKGEPGKEGCGVINDSVTQALRACSGLANHYFQPKRESGRDRVVHSQVFGQTVFIPVVVTTASLWTTAVDLGAANLETGDLETDLEVSKADWLWFKLNPSMQLRHEVTPVQRSHSTSLADELQSEIVRSVAIVSFGGLENFLRTRLEHLIGFTV